MSKLRSVNTHFWSDNYIIDLDPVEKLLFLYLITNESTNMLGIYEYHVRKMAFDTGIDRNMILKILDRFSKDGKISYVEGFIILHNFLNHQRMNDNMKKSAIATFKQLPDKIKKNQVTNKIRSILGDVGDGITTLVVSLSKREALFVKYRGVCQYCDEEVKEDTELEIDHVHPLSRDGSDTYSNLVLSCRKCNQEKLDKTPEEMGWKRPSTGKYHYNIARKDLLEVDWLRKKFNSVFNRKLCLNDGELIDVNHKHTINNPFQSFEKEEVEREVEGEREVETESESAGEKSSFTERLESAKSKKELFDLWFEYRKSKGRHPNLHEKDVLLNKDWKNKGIEGIRQAIAYTVANGWFSIQYPDDSQHGNKDSEPLPQYLTTRLG